MLIREANAGFIFLPPRNEALRRLTEAGSTAYRSRPKDDSAFVRMIVERGHFSVIEHVSLSAHFLVDRGISHELVRHRLASFTQESTRYCAYNKEKFGGQITVIAPHWLVANHGSIPIAVTWSEALFFAEKSYLKLLELGLKPEDARGVLPNALATQVYMTCNLREWKHVFALRTSPQAHPDMRAVMDMLYKQAVEYLPEVFSESRKSDNADFCAGAPAGLVSCVEQPSSGSDRQDVNRDASSALGAGDGVGQELPQLQPRQRKVRVFDALRPHIFRMWRKLVD